MTKFVSLCQKAIENWNGFTIPTEEIRVILETNSHDVVKTLEYWGYSEDGQSLDTADRDILHDAIAEYLGFTHWPCGIDSDKAWAEQFKLALENKIASTWKHC